MGVWLRIPLVHPEAMDPELMTPRPPVGSDDGSVPVTSDDGGAKGLKETEGEAIVVEDPWETWNTMRMLCEHKTG